jgi:Zn-dependent protease with chaperone function
MTLLTRAITYLVLSVLCLLRPAERQVVQALVQSQHPLRGRSRRSGCGYLGSLALLLILSGCAGLQARRQSNETWAQLFTLDRQLHEQFRQGRISYLEAAARLIELGDRLVSRSAHLEDAKLYRLSLAEQVDAGELDLATAKDLFREAFVEAVAVANPGARVAEIRLYRLVAEVVSALDSPRPMSDYRVYIVPRPGINAASAGGGVFYIWSGALDLPDRQLLALLAHEIAHDALHHVLKAQILDVIMVLGVAAINLKSPLAAEIANQVRVPILRAFTRAEEAEADAEAVRLLQRLGYSKAEVAALLQDLLTRYGNTGGGLLATHPLTTGRIAAVRAMPEDLAWADYRPRPSVLARRGWLGVETREALPDEAKALHLSSQSGAVVRYVDPGSPAERVGIRTGDILLQLDGHPLGRSYELRRLLMQHPPSSEVRVKVYRALAKTETVVSVTLSSPITQDAPPPVAQGNLRDGAWADEVRAAITAGTVLFGMTTEEVRSAWGPTGCEVAGEYDGEDTDALGYTIAGSSDAIGPAKDCDSARVFLHFREGILIGGDTEGEQK